MGDSVQAEEVSTLDQQDTPALNPAAKRKVALFAAYLGAGYSGMQFNPGMKTIEGELMGAMAKAGAVSEANAGQFGKVSWARAARTDKGVNALGQVVSLNMVLPEDVVEQINAHLPPTIRVLGFCRVIKGFDARRLCDKRCYEYFLPAWAFDPAVCKPSADQPEIVFPGRPPSPANANGCSSKAAQASLPGPAAAGNTAQIPAPATDPTAAQTAPATAAAALAEDTPASVINTAGSTIQPAIPITPADQPAAAAERHESLPTATGSTPPESDALPAADLSGNSPYNNLGQGSAAFSFDEAKLQRLNDILQHYVGTHNFHNFTIRVHSSDPSAARFIRSFKCDGIVHLEGQPWVRMVVVGQSFMLHQIRKMVGLALAIARGTAQDYVMHAALSKAHSVHVPMAPEGGLFLERCFFEAYNDRWSDTHGERVDVGVYLDQIVQFKMKQLYPHIANSETYRQQLQLFLRSLNERNFQFSRWKDVTDTKHSGSKPAATFNDSAHTRVKPLAPWKRAAQQQLSAIGHSSNGDPTAKKPRTESGSAAPEDRPAAKTLSHLEASMLAEYSD